MLTRSLVHLDVVSLRLIDLAGQGRHTQVLHDWLEWLGHIYLRAAAGAESTDGVAGQTWCAAGCRMA